MKRFLIVLMVAVLSIGQAQAQKAKLYDETIDPIAQINSAVSKAKASNKYVICQVGGNWCVWCLRFADFITKDSEIKSVIDKNYVYIHVNYPRKDAEKKLTDKIANAGRFGYPALVVMNDKGEVIHIQDSSFLEAGEGYDKNKVLRFLNGWTPKAVAGK